jgi:hypothetical protein
MKIRELKRESYFTIEFDSSIPFTEDNESHEGIFTIKELEVLIDLARSVVEDYHRNKNGDHPGYSDKVEDDPTNVDTDPPDQYNWHGLEEGREYNVYDDKDGHSCNTTADGG